MPDPRITKLAKILIHYALEIKPGQIAAYPHASHR